MKDVLISFRGENHEWIYAIANDTGLPEFADNPDIVKIKYLVSDGMRYQVVNINKLEGYHIVEPYRLGPMLDVNVLLKIMSDYDSFLHRFYLAGSMTLAANI